MHWLPRVLHCSLGLLAAMAALMVQLVSPAAAIEGAQKVSGCECDVSRCDNTGLAFSIASGSALSVACLLSGPAAIPCMVGTTLATVNAASSEDTCDELSPECLTSCNCESKCKPRAKPETSSTSCGRIGCRHISGGDLPEDATEEDEQACLDKCKNQAVELDCSDTKEAFEAAGLSATVVKKRWSYKDPSGNTQEVVVRSRMLCMSGGGDCTVHAWATAPRQVPCVMRQLRLCMQLTVAMW